MLQKVKTRNALRASRSLRFESLEPRALMDATGVPSIETSDTPDVEFVAPVLSATSMLKPLPSQMVVNTSNLDLALQAGVSHLQNILDANNNDLPFFAIWAMNKLQSQLYGNDYGSRPTLAQMEFERHLTSNVAGRALYALLLASDVTGLEIGNDAYQAYKSTVLLSLHKPRNGNWHDLDPANQMVTGTASDPRMYGSTRFDLTHIYNVGAGLRGAVALSALSDDPDATLSGYAHSSAELVDIAVYNLRKYYVYGGGEIGGARVYNWEAFRSALGLQGGDRFSPSVNDDIVPNWSNIWVGWSDPFLVYALVKHYEMTGHQASLDLALELRDYAFYSKFPLNPAQVPFHTFGHNFEVVGAMSAYARLALVTNDADMMERVRVRYEALRGTGFNSTGWSPENYGINSDVGEANCTAEVIETALTFAEWGWTEYYNDVERFTRGHLLPSQLLDTRFIVTNANPANDGQRDVVNRMYGAFGFPAPYGPVSTNIPRVTGGYFADITAGAVSTLSEIKRASYKFKGGVHQINLLFDTDNENLRFASPYNGNGMAMVTPKVAGDIQLRLPTWVDRNVLSQSLLSQNVTFTLEEHYLHIESPAVNQPIQLRLPLITQWNTETTNGRAITIRWQGDEVTSMSRMGTPMAFFPDNTANRYGAVKGDFDQDGDTDGRDFLIWQRMYGVSNPAADANSDGNVDGLDLAVWQEEYGETPVPVLDSELQETEEGELLADFGQVLAHCFTEIAQEELADNSRIENEANDISLRQHLATVSSDTAILQIHFGSDRLIDSSIKMCSSTEVVSTYDWDLALDALSPLVAAGFGE